MSPLLIALLPLIQQGIPEVVGLIKSLMGLKKKYPALTDEQIHAVVVAATAENEAGFDDLMARIAADQPKP